jgi:hypothetical protein
MIETRSNVVTFRTSFTLPGLDRYYPAGSYRVEIKEEPLDMSFPSSRRISTTITLRSGAMSRAWPVQPSDLEAALANDANEGGY